jgi:hypothetical protein
VGLKANTSGHKKELADARSVGMGFANAP